MEKYLKIYDLGKDFGYKYTKEFRPYKNIMWESRLCWGVTVHVLMMIDGCRYKFHMRKDHEYIGEMQSDYDKDDVRLYNASKMAQAIVKGITGKRLDVTELIENDAFLVRIKVNELNVRKGAGTEYPVVGEIKNGGVYTIIKTKGNWGYLKSGAGWINISSTYAEKL